MLDDRLIESFTIAEAAAELGANRTHLARVFTMTFGIAPHRYVIGRRVDRARRLLLAGHSPAEAAVESGFHDQAHLTRQFRSTLGDPGSFRGVGPAIRRLSAPGRTCHLGGVRAASTRCASAHSELGHPY